MFRDKHDEDETLDFDEQINGKRIITMIVRTDFEQLSRKKSPRSNDE